MRPFNILLPFATATIAYGINGKPNGEYTTLPPLREQAALKDAWTKSRIDAVPALLSKHGVDAWLLSQREYAEDTVFWSLKRTAQFSARRRTLQLFLASTTESSNKAYTWIDNTPSLWAEVLAVLNATNPNKIAVNINAELAFASGLHAGEFELLKRELGSKWASRFVDVPLLAIEFVGTLPKAQLDWYRKLQGTAWAMISEAFSNKVITPGKTTTEDVEWWLRSKIQEQNYSTWFHSSVEIVVPNTKLPSVRPEANVINYGDMLHVDFGVTALGMNTDTQHLAYVLFPGETERNIPKDLLDGLKKVNRLQDIAVNNMIVGSTGNEILKRSREDMKGEGIEGSIYSHAVGDWGHSAGCVIGMTNLQGGVPNLGELPLLSDTYYSVELYAEHFVEKYNSTMNFYQEEDVYWKGKEDGKDVWEWVWARQEKFHLIETPKTNVDGKELGDALRLQTL